MPYSLHNLNDLLVNDFKDKHIWQTVFDVWIWAGRTYDLLRKYSWRMEGIEIHRIYIPEFDLEAKYDQVYVWDVLQHTFLKHYDVVVLGDVLEHLGRDEAKTLLANLKKICNAIYVQIPYLHTQWVEFNNIYEVHKQNDLTHDLFMEEFPWFKLLWKDFILWLYKWQS